MKKICISLFLIGIIFLTVTLSTNSQIESSNYFRIHIRANSNSVEDQSVKYKVKEELVKFLTPYIANCQTKSEAVLLINKKRNELTNIANGVLAKNGFNYKATVAVENQEFPTRVYENVTLEKGYYDALIVKLGRATGDNWWCVVYPPMCFTGNESGIIYKSKILEIIQNFKSKKSALY